MNKQEVRAEVIRALAMISDSSIGDPANNTEAASEAIVKAIDEFEAGFTPVAGQRFTGPNLAGQSYGTFKIQKPRTSRQMAYMLGYGDHSSSVCAVAGNLYQKEGKAWIKRTPHVFEIPPNNRSKWLYELLGIRDDLHVFQTAESILKKMKIFGDRGRPMHSHRHGTRRRAAQYILNHWVELGYAEKDGVLYRLVKND